MPHRGSGGLAAAEGDAGEGGGGGREVGSTKLCSSFGNFGQARRAAEGCELKGLKTPPRDRDTPR